MPLAAALTLAALPVQAQDDEEAVRAGKLAFNGSCRTCHSLKEGDNRLGPNLHSIVGRKAGSEEYGYSPALRSSGLVWDTATLDRFIENPDAVIPGNNMKPYGGISDEQTRSEIVRYLESESAGPRKQTRKADQESGPGKRTRDPGLKMPSMTRAEAPWPGA